MVTVARVPDGVDGTELLRHLRDHHGVTLAPGQGGLKGKIFRIGHLGHFNELMLCGTLSGVEMGLELAGIPHRKGGAQAAIDFLAQSASGKSAERLTLAARAAS